MSFTEVIYAGYGLGFDGVMYWKLVSEYKFSETGQLSAYHLKRCVPSFTVRFTITFLNKIASLFHLSTISYSAKSIIVAFKILNISCLLGSNFLLLRLLDKFIDNIDWKKKFLASSLLFIGFGTLKMPFFQPVFTDTPALFLGTLMLYAFLEKRSYLLVLVTFLGYFTFPPLPFMGILLLVFPYKYESKLAIDVPNLISRHSKLFSLLFAILSTLFIAISLYLIFREDTSKYITSGTNPTNMPFLYISVVLMLVYMFFLTKHLFITELVYKALYILSKRWWLLFILIACYAGFSEAVEQIANRDVVLNVQRELPLALFMSVQNPLIFLVAHITYTGILSIFIMLHYKTLLAKVNFLGLGYYAVITGFLLLSFQSETRKLTPALPFFIFILILVFEKYTFNARFYLTVFVLQIIISKIWYPINQEPMQSYKDAYLSYPWQNYFMNSGPWMAYEVYYIKVVLSIIIFLVVFFIQRNSTNNKLSSETI